MVGFRPGDYRITDEAMEAWNLPEGSHVLDMGCGLGDSLNYIKEKYKFKGTGVDFSEERLEEAKKRHPDLEFIRADMEFLDMFTSNTFDGVYSECSLSLAGKADESLHEAYCIMKKGGKLFLSDLYIIDPTPEFLAEQSKKAQDYIENREHLHNHEEDVEEGGCDLDCDSCASSSDTCGSPSLTVEQDSHSCGDHDHDHDDIGLIEPEKWIVDYKAEGRFIMSRLLEILNEIGYVDIHWEDKSDELHQYVAEKIMQDGNLEGCLCDDAINPSDEFKTGYFMLIASKPER